MSQNNFDAVCSGGNIAAQIRPNPWADRCEKCGEILNYAGECRYCGEPEYNYGVVVTAQSNLLKEMETLKAEVATADDNHTKRIRND